MFSSLILFLKAMVMGLGVSAPPGPNAILLVNRTIRKGHLSGFLTGMGVAAADVVFAIIAGLSLSYVIGFINEKAFYIKLITGVLVAAIGIKLFLSNHKWEIKRRMQERSKGTPLQDFFSVFGMSLANPFTIFLFIALFPGMDVSFVGSGHLIPVIIVLGIFTGAAIWWYALSYTVNRFRRSMSLRKVVTISRVTGFAIIAIGVGVLLTVFISVRL